MDTSSALVGALALSLTGGTAHASTSLDYVALGDSYSAATRRAAPDRLPS